MIGTIERFRVQVLLRAGHTQAWVASHVGISERSVRRIADERAIPAVGSEADEAARANRCIGRPRKVAGFEPLVSQWLADEPGIRGVEIIRRLANAGCDAKATAVYDCVRRLRKTAKTFVARFEALPGEFSQHDFGEVVVQFADGSRTRYHFFATKMKYSRWVAVTLVPNQRVESLLRALCEHFAELGGIPLLAVFDRPKTITLKSKKNGHVAQWNPVFAQAMFDMGVAVELCWPYRANQKGAVENLVGWVKNSFFKGRVFTDEADLQSQLREWLLWVNNERPSRATGELPAERLAAELRRLRPLKETPDTLALRIPVVVGPTAFVTHDGMRYSADPEAIGFGGTLYLYRDRVVVETGRYRATHPRLFESGGKSLLPEHRAAQLAFVSGRRGRMYLMRQHILDLGSPAEAFLSEVVFQNERGWHSDVKRMHALLQRFGDYAVLQALKTAVSRGVFRTEYVESILADRFQPHLPRFT